MADPELNFAEGDLQALFDKQTPLKRCSSGSEHRTPSAQALIPAGAALGWVTPTRASRAGSRDGFSHNLCRTCCPQHNTELLVLESVDIFFGQNIYLFSITCHYNSHNFYLQMRFLIL